MSIVLVIGGTGTLGSHVVPLLLQDPQIERVRILSRNEHKQAQMQSRLNNNRVDFMLGDIRDEWRIGWAMRDVHQVYHFAATKRVESAEYNAREAFTVNCQGTENVIKAILDTPTVEKCIFTSTDKACAPVNLYGATKMVAEKYWIAANVGKHRARFSAARYGNVFGSQGSVIDTWRRRANEGKSIQVTNHEMTRFFIPPSEAAQFVVSSMRRMNGGEIFVPRMKSTTMEEMGNAFIRIVGNNVPIETIPCRPGEKRHEVLISEDQVPLTTWDGDRFIQWPEFNLYPVTKLGTQVTEAHTSFNAERFTEQELMDLCSQSLS